MTIVQPPTTSAATLLPTFTVSSALRWLGHDCSPRCCAEPMESLIATLWFLRSERQFVYPLRTLILVDSVAIGGEAAEMVDLFDRVAHCAWTDAISVRPRHGRWMRATTSAEPGETGSARDGDVATMPSARSLAAAAPWWSGSLR